MIVDSIGAILLVIGIWLVLQFIMRKAGLPTWENTTGRSSAVS